MEDRLGHIAPLWVKAPEEDRQGKARLGKRQRHRNEQGPRQSAR